MIRASNFQQALTKYVNSVRFQILNPNPDTNRLSTIYQTLFGTTKY